MWERITPEHSTHVETPWEEKDSETSSPERFSVVYSPPVHNRKAEQDWRYPSMSFGGTPEWHCKTDTELLTLFNSKIPFRSQKYWALCHIHSSHYMRVISVLRLQGTVMGKWRRLPKTKKIITKNGSHIANLWELTILLAKGTTTFTTKVGTISRFSTGVKIGYYIRGHQVAARTVSSVLAAIGQEISMEA